MRPLPRRVKVLTFGGLALVFALALVLLRPQVFALSDDQYIAIAKDTPQGQLYFVHHDAVCSVVRAWNVQVACDTVKAGGASSEKFRVYIDPRTNEVVDTDMSFDP
jgi:hypothetical protein